MIVSSRLLSVGPRIRKVGGSLVISTAWRLRALTLGSFHRQVTVDPSRREVAIHRRWAFLLARSRVVPFSNIKAVTYGYHDLAIGALSMAHHSTDLFTVGLRLHRGRDCHLSSFFGEGAFRNDGVWPDWLYWEDNLLDATGTQETESRILVDLLGRMIGVPIVPA